MLEAGKPAQSVNTDSVYVVDLPNRPFTNLAAYSRRRKEADSLANRILTPPYIGGYTLVKSLISYCVEAKVCKVRFTDDALAQLQNCSRVRRSFLVGRPAPLLRTKSGGDCAAERFSNSADGV